MNKVPFYPYTEEGIKQALKEMMGTDSPVVPGSVRIISTIGEAGGAAKGRIALKTEDGEKYQIVVQGTFDVAPYHNELHWERIKTIERK